MPQGVLHANMICAMTAETQINSLYKEGEGNGGDLSIVVSLRPLWNFFPTLKS